MTTGTLLGVSFTWVPLLDHLEVAVDFENAAGARERAEIAIDLDMADELLTEFAAAVASAEDRP